MRVVFMGTPDFAVSCLESLDRAHEVVAVFTRPDRPRGRGREPQPSPVNCGAKALGLEVITPETLRDPSVFGTIEGLDPDVICVVAYGMLLPAEVLRLPRHGCVNVHASLLPRHRGAAPIHRAVLEGDEYTGVSVMRMEEGLDTGLYTCVKRVAIGRKGVGDLERELAVLGAEALLETLSALDRGSVAWQEQDEALATYAEKVTDADLALDPALTVEAAWRRVRVSTRSARSKASIGGRVVDIVAAEPADASPGPGLVDTARGGLVLGFSDGGLRVLQVRGAGKQQMACTDWVCGARIARDAGWGPA